MTPSSSVASEHLSSFELDLLQAGELDAGRAKRASEHLQACADCREEQAALLALHREFEHDVFPRTASRFRRTSERVDVPFYRRPVVWAPLLASAAAIALALRLNVSDRRASEDTAEIQAKGGASLSLLVRREGTELPVTGSMAELRTGDELRFVLVTTDERARQVLIVSVDGAGKASVYLPFEGNASRAVEQRGRWEVPGSVILDDTPGPERIFALLAAERLDARPVLEALGRVGRQGWGAIRGTARLELPGVEQHSVLIEKVAAQSP